MQAAEVDWVPGAYSIIPANILREHGFFDPRFFLYYEEVDLCRRIKNAGYEVCYWPDVVVTHLGGESSRQLKTLEFSSTAAQVVLWRMRSSLLYYRKHHGASAWFARRMEQALYTSGPRAPLPDAHPADGAGVEGYARGPRLSAAAVVTA
jgi:GT2 family glycosyltransferase